VARREETIEKALRRGFINVGTCDLAEGVKQADLIALATPVRTILELIPQVGSLAPAGCLLMDLGSTKARVVEAMKALPPYLQAIGGHPMCGKEASGIEAAEADLYEEATFVLTPLRRTSPEALALAQELVEAVGAQPLLMDAERHDRLVAAVSHLPYLLSVGLVAAAEEVAAEDELVWELAVSGFRDTSRLAASDVTMMLDILLTNRQAVGETLSRFVRQLDAIAHLLEANDEERLRNATQAVIASEAKQSPYRKEEIASSQKTLLAMTRAEQLLRSLMEQVQRRREGMFR
jgi:prephenate dehydrogenase